MLRLVWKDIVLGGWILLAAIPIYVLQLAGMPSVAPALLFVTLFFTGAFAFGSIGIEEIQGTEALWCSLPISRAEIVLARYATTATGIVLGLVASAVVTRAAAWMMAGSREPREALGWTAYVVLLALFLGCAALFLPCYFRFGAGQGLLVFSVLVLGILVLVSAFGSLAVYLAGGAEAIEALRARNPERIALARAWVDRWGAVVAGAVAAGAIVFFAASAVVSVRLFETRDC